MKINGREIAGKIFEDLKIKVEKLRKKGTIPHLYIITLTTDPASEAYVGQKRKKGAEIGAKITLENLDPKISTEELLKKVEKLNNDQSVHGIIIQRPLPPNIDERAIANSINPNKDVDGFHPNSKFSPPVGEAVIKILEEVHSSTSEVDAREPLRFTGWLRSKKISVIGRGVTAGAPIIKTLVKIGVKPLIVASQTQNRKEILKNSNIVICAVGKPDILKKSDIKKGAILIGVGMFRADDGKFHSDYEEEDIKDIASSYTPTPGGVGPVNVSMLLSNLLKSAENSY